jgi:hypothetical protein
MYDADIGFGDDRQIVMEQMIVFSCRPASVRSEQPRPAFTSVRFQKELFKPLAGASFCGCRATGAPLPR